MSTEEQVGAMRETLPQGSEAAPAEAGPAKRRWIRGAQLRSIILDHAVDLLKDEGLGLAVDHITFKKVFSRVEDRTGLRITNSSVIGRIWRDQAEFQLDLVLAAADITVTEEIFNTLGPFLELVEHADRSTVATRQATISQLCRVAGQANLDWLTQNTTWPMWIGIWLTSITGEPTERRAQLRQRMLANYQDHSSAYQLIYAEAMAHLGHRVREPYTVAQLTDAIMALADGCAVRFMLEEQAITGIMRPTGPNGEPQEWNLFSIGLEGLVWQFIEPIPRWRPTAG